MSTPKKKERQKLIKCFLVFGCSEKERRKVQTISKYVTKSTGSSRDGKQQQQQQQLLPEVVARSGRSRKDSLTEEDIDESSIALLCLPDGIQVKRGPASPKFHSFLITMQNGSRIYGSSLIFWEPAESREELDGGEKVYSNKALCFLTTVPFVIAMKSLLFYIWENNLSSAVIHSICNVKMPNKGKCIKLILPRRRKSNEGSAQIKLDSDLVDGGEGFTEIYVYRGLSSFPLFDYPLRELFMNILSLDKFLTAFVATLLEFQILVMSHDYQQLMFVAEALTSVLLPFQWQHVYVPILPSKLGLNYLDAPTPYIMGINTISAKESIATVSWSSSVQCRVDCDSDKVDYYCDDNEFQQYLLQNTPPFIEELKAEVESILSSDLKLTTQSAAVNRNQSEALKRVTEVVRKYQVIASDFTYLEDLKLNQSIRIAFMRAIKKYILTDYERFIVATRTPRDNVKFDSVSYLCDQPDSMRPFLTKFLETQMFASLVDETAKRAHKSKQGLFSSQQSLHTVSTCDDPDDLAVFNDLLLETRFSTAQDINIYSVKSEDSTNEDTARVMYSPLRKHSRSRLASEAKLSQLSQDTKEESGKENKGQGDVLSSPVRVPAAFAAQTNWKVVESLLKEVKAKTKRILLEKMGSEEIAPLGCGSVGDMEENTLIAALCDLLERIWSHATVNDNEQAKCSFWAHLVAFTALDDSADVQPTIDSSLLTPALSQLSLDSSPSVSPSSLSTPSSPSKQPSTNHHLKPIPTTIQQDFKSVQLMSDVKTDIGKSRAFIRLALERKLLSKHLRTLLNNQSLLVSMYKRYAFLRCEEEREQFLTHLLTLNAVDLMCFTNTFNTSIITYTLVVYGSNTLSGWVSVSGTLGSMSELYLANPTNYFTFKHKNLGILTTLTVSVSHTSKVFIEYCFIRNDLTGHTYKFACNQWFGRTIDDGATERVLIAQMLVSGSIGDVIKKSQQGRSSSIGRHWSRTMDTYRDEQLEVDELQEKLGEIVNQIVRFYYTKWSKGSNVHEESTLGTSPVKRNGQGLELKYSQHVYCNTSPSKASATMTHKQCPSFTGEHEPTLIRLLFGEKQLLWTLQQIFYYGFKNRGRSSFRKQIFLWDYLLRIHCELKLLSSTGNKEAHAGTPKEQFVILVDNISSKAANWGKDGKLQLFLVVSLRDHLLTHFLKLMTRPLLAQQFYESSSFLRDKTLLSFLFQILATFNDMALTIEPSLTKFL